MIKYDFSLDGIPVSVVSAPLTVRRAVAESLADDGYAVIVYPVDGADFGVACIDKNGAELREGHIPLMAISRFFKDVRHFPNITVEVLFGGVLYNVSVGAEVNKFSVNLGKCKFICAKTVEFGDGVQIEADIIDDGEACICTVCADSEVFSRDRLGELSRRLGMKSEVPALAVSVGEVIRVRSVGTLPFYRAMTVALSTLARHGARFLDGTYTAEVDGKAHSFYHSAGKLTFYPNIKYLS